MSNEQHGDQQPALARGRSGTLVHGHTTIGFAIATLGILLQLKYQQQQSSNNIDDNKPSTSTTAFQSHPILLNIFVVSLLISAAVSEAVESGYGSKLVDRVGTLAATLAATLAVLCLIPLLGWILLCLWIAHLSWVAYTSHREIHDLFRSAVAKSIERLIVVLAAVRSSRFMGNNVKEENDTAVLPA